MFKIIKQLYSDFVSFLIAFSNYIFNLRVLGFVILASLLFISTFKVQDAELTNNVLVLAGMILLMSIFADLKKFDFWGIKGERLLKETLEKTESKPIGGKDNIDLELKHSKFGGSSHEEVEVPTPITLMDTATGNFLKLSFEIEKLSREAVARILNEPVNSSSNIKSLIKTLFEKEIISDFGKKQMEAILQIRNYIVHGRSEEINEDLMRLAIDAALNIYSFLYNLLYPQQNKA